MIIQKPQIVDTEKTHRRKGGAFDVMGRVFRNVTEFVFQNSFLMRNRPGESLSSEEKSSETGRVNVKNTFEAYYTESDPDKINIIILGRKGNGLFRNTNLLELAARYQSSIGSKEGLTNGWLKMRVTRDDEDPAVDRSGVSVFDVGSVVETFNGISCQIVGQGPQGGVVISHVNNKDVNPNSSAATARIVVTENDISMYGLPTSASGLSAGSLYIRTLPPEAGGGKVIGIV